MADTPPQESNGQSSGTPAAEELKPKSADASPGQEAAIAGAKPGKNPLRTTYRPSHKATFVGLAVIVAILAVNVAVITFVIKKQSGGLSQANQAEVVLTPGVLDRLGVNRGTVGDSGVELVVAPNSRFSGKVQVGGDVSIGGELKLNSKFTATDASLAQLEAGKTSLADLNVNGDATVSALNLRNNLAVAGQTRLQGPVTINQLLTVANNANIAGNLAVGGVLSTRGFQATNLVVDSTLTIGGHFITRGSPPTATPGPGLGNNGTMSISGTDAAGTISINTGTGAQGGILANVTFRNQYGSSPRVVATVIGGGTGSVFVNRNTRGFSVGINGPIAPGGYAIDYIVMQ